MGLLSGAQRAALPMTLPNSSAGTLLLIDHEVDGLQALRTYLEQHHYRVCTEREDRAALELIPTMQPDLVLLGMNLPDKDCRDVCRAIKSTRAPAFLPVVLMADRSLDEQTLEAEQDADGLLVKPIREADALMQVGALLRIKSQVDALWSKNQALLSELEKRNAELEKAVRESREASLLKDSIVKNVSHELKTPLVQVKAAVALMAEDARAASPSGVSALADMATAATAKLESVVQNITQLAATVNIKLEAFRLSDAVSVAVRQTGRQWLSLGAVDRIKAAVDDVPLLMGDRSGVAQVLQQLIDNAIKFSPNGGDVEITGRPEANGIRIAVSDHGIGIASDQLERIFQAFYQVDSSTTRPFGGAGVGLAIVKLLLDKMGTAINVESTPGVGSTFSFLLSVAPPDKPPESPQAIAVPSTESGNQPAQSSALD
jgi:signal transduction histidine kinase